MTLTFGQVADMINMGDSIPVKLRDMKIKNLLTDSRSLLEPENTLFFAIPTRTNSGEKYMGELYGRGVRMFVAPEIPEEMKDKKDVGIIICKDPVALLQKVASRHDTDSVTEVVGITGSKGKTLLKEWLFQLLEPLHEIARSPRSYNSQIGVPLSMWEIGPGTDLAIIEAGISRSGEMRKLEECIRPDTVLLTDLGEEHSEGFTNQQEKIREKLILAERAKKLIYCEDDELVKKEIGAPVKDKELIGWSMSNPGSSLFIKRIENVDPEAGEKKKVGKRIVYSWLGEEGSVEVAAESEAEIRTAIYALCYMLSSGYPQSIISRRFSYIHPIETRMIVSEGGDGSNIIFDSYTSDITSLVPALDFMARRRMPGQRSVVIMSDLRHEGSASGDDYQRIAQLIRLRGIDLFIGVGPQLTRHKNDFSGNTLFFNTVSELSVYLKDNPPMDAVVLLKGAPQYDFGRLKEVLDMRTHQTVLEVNLDSIVKNYRYFKSHLPSSTGMIVMVKAFGYGAGSYEISKTLQDAGASYLAVAVLDEGIDLRRQGIRMPIMVMNPRVADYREMFENNLEPEIYTLSMLDDVINSAARCGVSDYPIHVKLDTGMHRMGLVEEELPELISKVKAQSFIRISSVFSHLATADEPSMDDYTEMQLSAFDRCSGYILKNMEYPVKRHVLNSAGILRYGERYHYDMARLGIGLYGVRTLPSEMEKPLDVVSSLKTVIINLREWPAGTTVGYGRCGKLERTSVIATIPIGYADGMSRKFGNGAIQVLVNGREAPTIGNICMDACMIDVTGIECKVGDTVEIFGGKMPVGRLADAMQTIPYEVLTSVSPRVKRVYFRE